MLLTSALRSCPLSTRVCRQTGATRFVTSAAVRTQAKSYNLSDIKRRDLSCPIRVTSKDCATLDHIAAVSPDDLVVYPEFLTPDEQEVLLGAGLKKLESGIGSREERKRKKDWLKKSTVRDSGFLPEAVYEFQQRHFDGVISGYRETTLSSWPESASPSLPGVLSKIYALLPPSKGGATSQGSPLATPPHLLTHLLHLSSTGYILPHVDNLEASAGSILGVSLGARRELVLEYGEEGTAEEVRITLDPGSAYIQRGDIRYKWKHSIPLPDSSPSLSEMEELGVGSGQRLSVMVRDRL